MSNNVGAKTPETKPTDRATNLLAQPADTARYFRRASLQVIPAAPSGAPSCASAPPVKGVLSITPNSRKRFFHLFTEIQQLSGKDNNFRCLREQISAKHTATAETKVNKHTTSPLIHRLNQRLTANPQRNTQQPHQNQRRYHASIATVSQRCRKKGRNDDVSRE